MKVGVLALQGDFAEHIAVLKRLGVEGHEIRLPEHLEGVDGLIIPGGESTTLSRLMSIYSILSFLLGNQMWSRQEKSDGSVPR